MICPAAGAIPVFVGPPFHAMPFAGLIDYSEVGLVFNITGPRPWISEGDEEQPNALPMTLSAPGSGPLDIFQASSGGHPGVLCCVSCLHDEIQSRAHELGPSDLCISAIFGHELGNPSVIALAMQQTWTSA